MVASLGGPFAASYFAFGEDDFVVIYDMPDNVSALSPMLSGVSSGAVQVKTAVLITPEEADQAVKPQTPVISTNSRTIGSVICGRTSR